MNQSIPLDIAFAQKDVAKKVAAAAGIRLSWSKDTGWVAHTHQLPPSLLRYLPAQPRRLNIPYAKKDEAKAAANRAGGRLTWSKDTGWVYFGPELPRELAEYASSAEEPSSATVPRERKTFLLDIPFQLREWAKSEGAAWDSALRSHVYRGAELPSLFDAYTPAPYSLEAALQKRVCPEIAIKPNGNHGKPFDPHTHQSEGAEQIAAAYADEAPGFLVADGVGTGKTLTVWLSVLKTTARSVLIVCPLSAVTNWVSTIQRAGDGGKEIIIINYDRLQKLFEASDADKKNPAVKASTRRRRLSKSGDLIFDVDTAIFDEAHKMGNITSLRSKFGWNIHQSSGFTIWATATAGERPTGVIYMAGLLGHLTNTKVEKVADFEKVCRKLNVAVSLNKHGGWYWAGNDNEEVRERDCDTIGRTLFGSHLAIRRMPQDIAGWPQLNRILHPVTLTREEKDRYSGLYSTYRSEMETARASKNQKQNALVAQLRFRQKASLIRVQDTADLAQTLLEGGQRVAISVQFHATIEALEKEIGARGNRYAYFTGKQSAKEREENRIEFQRGEADVIFYTVEEAINLHQGEYPEFPTSLLAHSNIIHDLRWSAIPTSQIEGRCHRNGVFSNCYWSYARETVEERIAEVMSGRIKTMAQIHADSREVREIDALIEAIAA